ncbi:MAG: hypothetical protein QNJ31_08530 [Candidatus Caenarcaniphilales bacterium]|nr:hypothetical protein [Candidatus Caenarcaniphilales bacterium]
MKYPKVTLFFTIFLLVFLLAQDLLFNINFTPLVELIHNIAFIMLGSMVGIVIYSLKHGNEKKPELIDEDKLAFKVLEDEKKQLKEKIKTLEAALERLMK